MPFCQVDTLLESWPWWLFEYLAPSHKSRVLDCFLMEGHKVLFRWTVPLSPLFWIVLQRSALALLKSFYKQCGQKRKGGENLEDAFRQFCTAPEVQPQELMARAFKFPRWWPDIQSCPYFFAIFVHAFHTSFYRFSKGDISKLTARLEVRPHNPIVKITNPLFMLWNPIATLKPDNPNVKNTIPPFMFWNPFAKTLKGGGTD